MRLISWLDLITRNESVSIPGHGTGSDSNGMDLVLKHESGMFSGHISGSVPGNESDLIPVQLSDSDFQIVLWC